MRIKVTLYKCLILALAVAIVPVVAVSAQKITAGDTCPKAGKTIIQSGIKYFCVKKSGKLVWNKGVKVASSSGTTSKPSTSKTNKSTKTPSKPTPKKAVKKVATVTKPIKKAAKKTAPVPTPAPTPKTGGGKAAPGRSGSSKKGK